MKTEIVSIKLKFGKKEVELSKEEAADLHKQLSELFPAPVSVVVPWTYPVYQPSYVITTPYCTTGTLALGSVSATCSTGNLGMATASNRCEAISFNS